MKVSNICNPTQFTNFGANFDGNYYLRNEVRNVVKNGSLEDLNLLSALLGVIKDDTSAETFKMDKQILSSDKKLVRYIFTMDGTQVLTSIPCINPSAFRNDGDILFLKELDWFVKNNYSKKVYQEAIDNKPQFMQRYLTVVEQTNKQFKQLLRETLDLEPERYIINKKGQKVPCDSSNNPINPLDYVC